MTYFSPDCTCVRGFHEFHGYRSGECVKSLHYEMCDITPRDSTGVVSDNDFQRTSTLCPSTVSNSLWSISVNPDTSNCKLVYLY